MKTQKSSGINTAPKKAGEKNLKLSAIFTAILSILMAGFIYLQYVWDLKSGFKKILETQPQDFTISDISLVWVPILSYVLLSIETCLVIRMLCEPIKEYSERGLIYGLIGGLICGLISGLLFGLLCGLSFGLMSILFFGLVFGLLFGILFGFVFVRIEKEKYKLSAN